MSAERPTVYVMRTANGTALYVGATVLPAHRLYQHEMGKDWWGQVDRVDIHHFATQEEALLHEAELIAWLCPPHNRRPGTLMTLDQLRQRRERKERRQAETDARVAEWREQRDPRNRADYMYRVPDLHCENCGWRGGWIQKGHRIDEVACINCDVVALAGTPAQGADEATA